MKIRLASKQSRPSYDAVRGDLRQDYENVYQDENHDALLTFIFDNSDGELGHFHLWVSVTHPETNRQVSALLCWERNETDGICALRLYTRKPMKTTPLVTIRRKPSTNEWLVYPKGTGESHPACYFADNKDDAQATAQAMQRFLENQATRKTNYDNAI